MRKLIPLALLILFAAGCSTTMVPVGTSKAPGAVPAVDLIVGQKFPRFYRNDPFTPIHVTFRNNTDKWIPLRQGQFTLIDPEGRQYVIGQVDEVFDWLHYERWSHYYAPHYPNPIERYVFREGRLKPHKQIQAVLFFNQATHYGQGTYRLIANIPQNGRPLEYTFRLD